MKDSMKMLLVPILILAATPTYAQTNVPKGPFPLTEDVETIDDYYKDNVISEAGFFEKEIHRVTQRFGNMVHVWSSYEWRTSEDGAAGGRGINSIQLFHDGKRWWITSWIYDSERDDNPLPKEFSPKH